MKKTYAKQLLSILLSALLMLVLAMVVNAEGTIIYSGNCGADGDNLTYTLDDNGLLKIFGSGKFKDWGFTDYEFKNSIKQVYFSKNVSELDDYNFAFYACPNLEQFIISEDNPYFSSLNNRDLYSKDGTVLYAYLGKEDTFVIPEGVKETAHNVFYINIDQDAYKNTHLVLPKTLEKVPDNSVNVVFSSITAFNPDMEWPFETPGGGAIYASTIYGYIGSTAQRFAENWQSYLSNHTISYYPSTCSFIDLCPSGHSNATTVSDQPATCISAGFTAGTYCPDCDRWLSGHERIASIDPNNHINIENKPVQVSTCTASGYTAGVQCKDCSKWLSGHDEIALNPNNHINQKTYEAVAFTCTTNGYTAGVKCEDCGEWLSGHEVIPAHHVDENVDGICDVCTLRFAYILKLNEPLTLDYTNSSEEKVLFTPTETGFYRLTSEEIMKDGYAEIEDKDGREPDCIYAEDEKLTVNALLQAGETYTISIRSYQTIDSLTVIMTKQEAPSGFCGEGVHWTLDETGTLTISGTGAIEDYDLFDDTVIPPWIEYADYIEAVVVNNGVTRIGDFAFYGMQKQCASVTLPETLESIGTGAFVAWGQLQEVTIPASVTSIGAAAFFQTPLQKITLLNPSCEILEIFTYTDSETGETEEEDLGAWTLGFEETTVYGYPNSTAEAYAEKYERTFIALEPPAAEPMTETDIATGIAVTYDSDAYTGEITLSVNKVENGGNYLVKTYEKTTAWDITTLLNGVETQPVEPVTVSIPVPDGYNENALAVYHVNDKGEAEKVEPITVKDGIITFTATAFSVYVVVDESSEVKPHTHTYTATITTDPTCTADGETTYTCTICGDTYTETIPATGNHVDSDNDGKCDTCGEKMTGGKHCKYCGKIHNGNFFDKLTGFFHKILAIFKR